MVFLKCGPIHTTPLPMNNKILHKFSLQEIITT